MASSRSLEHGAEAPVEGLPGAPGTTIEGPQGRQIQEKYDPRKRGTIKTSLLLSPEELEIFQQCRRESFLYRCLPIGGLFGLATNRLIAAGFLKTGRFGPGPKYMVAAVLGWVVGKWTYMKPCENKFLRLEHSMVGDLIRKKRGMAPIGDGPSGDPWGTQLATDQTTPGYDGRGSYQAPDSGFSSPVQSSDYGSSSSFGQDSSGVMRDDDVSPIEAFGPMSPLEDDDSKKYMTYEELRKKNREASSAPVSSSPSPSFQPSYRIGRDGSRESLDDRPVEKPWKKNQYGDLYRD